MKLLFTCLFFIALNSVFASTLKIEKWHTKNGVRVVFYQAMEVPMLDISMAFAAGAAHDGKHYGLSTLTTHLLDAGAAGQNAQAIAATFADTGAQFDATSTKDMAVLNLRTLTDAPALDKATTALAQIISHPDFPNLAFKREQQQLLRTLEQTQESPEEIANIRFFQTLYQNHPYAHAVNGTKKTLQGITRQDVVQFYHRYFVASNAVLVIVGAIDLKKAHDLADKLTHALPQGTPATTAPKALPLTQHAHIAIPFPSTQTVVRLGQIGIDHNHPNYFPLLVGNYILGGGNLVSRLTLEVREKRGLTYGVSSQFVPMPGEGPFLISLSTKNTAAKEALSITKNTLALFVNKGPSDEELNAAKQFLTGSFPMSIASNRSIANLLLRMTFYKLPDDYLDHYVQNINAVTNDQIRTAFKNQVNLDKLLLVTVGQS